MRYYQCELRRGDQVLTSWIEERGATVGASVEVVEDGNARWTITQVFRPPVEAAELAEKQRMDRRSLPSIKGG